MMGRKGIERSLVTFLYYIDVMAWRYISLHRCRTWLRCPGVIKRHFTSKSEVRNQIRKRGRRQRQIRIRFDSQDILRSSSNARCQSFDIVTTPFELLNELSLAATSLHSAIPVTAHTRPDICSPLSAAQG